MAKRLRIFIFVLVILFLFLFLEKQSLFGQNPKTIKETISKTTKPKTIGLTMFRGNATRTFYGTGPLPQNPEVIWKYPKEKPMCGNSTVGGATKLWCGNGWTGQPVVWERPDGITEVIFGAYDRAIHFLNAETGEQTRASFQTGDIIKGSVTLDPDGFPLLYSGSRDNFFRIIALDREHPTELWKIEAKISEGLWNNDWDGNALIENDYLYEGSENGLFHIIKLNRSYDQNKKVTVSPVEVFKTPTFSKEFLEILGDDIVSVESSPMKIGDVVYIANSGGRIMGFDVSKIEQGIVNTVFDFWAGDDIDATLVSDKEGYIYAVSEDERKNQRSKEIGQIMKLDPRNPNDPLLWSIHVPGNSYLTGGVWATPALYKGNLYVVTNPGDLLVINTKNGEVLNKVFIGEHSWSSPNIIDDALVFGSCQGKLKTFSIKNESTLEEISSIDIGSGGCIEATPAIWKGNIYFGTREGFFFKVGEKALSN